MEKKQYELCHEVLRRFHQQGLLNDIILIGSWCLPFYEEYFRPSKVMDEASLKTRDIDFLIPRPSRITKKVDIPELVKDLGFVPTFGGGKGYMKLDHPYLIMEFLVPERGRGTDKPVPLPTLGMNATSIRTLTFISDNTILAKLDDFFIKLPHPANFALHKLIVSGKRKNQLKAEKDSRMAIDILEALVTKGDQAIVKEAFDSVPSKWQDKIVAGLDKQVHRRILAVLRPI
ncbi:MAG: nucleotidyltransferase domain-containing protein [Elusimicrobia bacterium]|nr:nucleotidyltransferase domain-containing protein [Candidatus Obscuribacterium magneticum]